MDNKKAPEGSPSASSITSQLFGSQSSSSSSSSSSCNDIFASIFPPKEVGGNSICSEMQGSWQKDHSGFGNQPWNTKPDDTYKHEDASHGNIESKEKNSIYPQEGADPCNLSSSLYYGGQDIYSKSPTQPPSTSYPMYNKDGGEGDPNGANWWEGSLYY